MAKDYESLFILKPDLADEEIDKEVESVKESIKSAGGSIIEEDRWGKKRLAYLVRKNRYGYYVLLRFSLDPAALSGLDHGLRLNENTLKHMIVLYDGSAGRKETPPEEEKTASGDPAPGGE
ncbi:MAG: 30S ribosomal protein S6 [Candidatus Nitrospinota bacterium M3_3B_026]